MVFPFRKIWGQDTFHDPSDRIDRELTSRSRRLVVGLSVREDFAAVDGALVVCEGHGKFMRVEYAVCVSEKVDELLRESCLALLTSTQPVQSMLTQVTTDLADLQAVVVDRLRQKAGKYVNRVLTVAVTDPGLWTKDFDGSKTYTSLCDAIRLAEKSGVTVIDAFPAQDVAVGGRGVPLVGLPVWLMMSDRNKQVATNVNAAFVIGEQFDGYLLPPSDGLDLAIPPIEPIQGVGLKFFWKLIEKLSSKVLTPREIDELLIAGVHVPELLARWQSRVTRITEGDATFVDFSEDALLNRLVDDAVELSLPGVSIGNVICTALELMATNCTKQIVSGLHGLKTQYEIEQARIAKKLLTLNAKRRSNATIHRAPDFSKIGNLVLATRPEFERAFLSKFQNLFSESEVGLPQQFVQTVSANKESLNFAAVLTALLGLMHVDQMPGNLPQLTGGQQQRILGRLTPGRPNQWRQLIREMADFQPPVMKLKDAV